MKERLAETGKTAASAEKPGGLGKRRYVNASFGELEELVDRGLTPFELNAVHEELCYRKPRQKTVALMARVKELLSRGNGSP